MKQKLEVFAKVLSEYGEDFFIYFEDEKVDIFIYYPKIIIGRNQKSHTIFDFYVWISSINSFHPYGSRSKITTQELSRSYIHSHLNIVVRNNSIPFGSFCTGSSIINADRDKIRLSFNSDDLKNLEESFRSYMFSLNFLLTTENHANGHRPYTSFSDIEQNRNIPNVNHSEFLKKQLFNNVDFDFILTGDLFKIKFTVENENQIALNIINNFSNPNRTSLITVNNVNMGLFSPVIITPENFKNLGSELEVISRNRNVNGSPMLDAIGFTHIEVVEKRDKNYEMLEGWNGLYGLDINFKTYIEQLWTKYQQ